MSSSFHAVAITFACLTAIGCSGSESVVPGKQIRDLPTDAPSLDAKFLATIDLSESPPVVQDLISAASKRNIVGVSADEFKDAWSHFDSMSGGGDGFKFLSYFPEMSLSARAELDFARKTGALMRRSWIFVRIRDGKIDDVQGVMQGL